MKALFFVLFLSSPSLFAQSVNCNEYTFQQFLNEKINERECATFKGPQIIFNKEARTFIRKSFKKHLKSFETRGFYSNNFSQYLISFMVKSEGKHFPVYVNVEGVGYRAFFFDNGADYFKDEVARIEHKGKIGFINKKGEVLIKPQYLFVTPFRNGYAKACQKCVFGKEKEHPSIKSDDWFFIDKKNEKVFNLPPIAKLPFDINLQKKLFEKPFSNTVESRAKLKKMCKGEKLFCINYATFFFEENLGFSLDYYKFNYHDMNYSTHVESEGKGKKPEEILKTFKKLAKKEPKIESHRGLALYMYGKLEKGLKVLKSSCEKKNKNACKLHKRLQLHALSLKN